MAFGQALGGCRALDHAQCRPRYVRSVVRGCQSLPAAAQTRMRIARTDRQPIPGSLALPQPEPAPITEPPRLLAGDDDALMLENTVGCWASLAITRCRRGPEPTTFSCQRRTS